MLRFFCTLMITSEFISKGLCVLLIHAITGIICSHCVINAMFHQWLSFTAFGMLLCTVRQCGIYYKRTNARRISHMQLSI